MDTSSELIHSLLPLFLTLTLEASVFTVGIVEGFAEAASATSKVISGFVSDYFRKRKTPVLFGYTLSALTKPLFPLASSVTLIFIARFFDRIGKGIRVAPRDALVADITPSYLRGSAYGLRQALDSFGAFFGPTIALFFMISFESDIRTVLWIGVLPALLAVVVLIFGVEEPTTLHSYRSKPKLSLSRAKLLGGKYWLIVTLGALFYLSRISEAFFILRAQKAGLPVQYAPSVLIVMNLTYSIFSYPAGIFADKLGAITLLTAGLFVLIFSHILMAVSDSFSIAILGSAFLGLHMAITQGLFSKLVADSAPFELRATAFGIFNVVVGFFSLFANALAGLLWTKFGANVPFLVGAFFASLTLITLIFHRTFLSKDTAGCETR